MFSLLSPLSLWLGALLAIPLVIHFLGRQRLRKEPFPSLLLVEERFAKSMQRHRLKNLLLLLIRTLLILCLLLALANPVLNARSAPRSGVDAAAALIHNGAYGLLPVGRGRAQARRRTAGPAGPRRGTPWGCSAASSGRWIPSWARACRLSRSSPTGRARRRRRCAGGITARPRRGCWTRWTPRP